MKDEFTRDWIITNAQKILSEYSEGITIRQLHYRLVAIGMTNDMNHYKRVVTAMKKARWDSIIDMESFVDRERSMYWETKIDEKDVDDEVESAKRQIELWMKSYHLNRWSNQDNFVEVWIEKKALQGVFERPCMLRDVGLAPCKGYPSITFLYDASLRFNDAIAEGKHVVLLYFGDHDPSGDNIPVSIQENLYMMGADVEVVRVALTSAQIKEMNLPGVPPKHTDSRTANWNGTSAVECDAIEPHALARMCADSIDKYFDRDKYYELEHQEEEERKQYQEKLKEYVSNMDLDKDEGDDE